MRQIIIFAIIGIFSIISLSANQTMLKGKVVDALDNNPKEVEIMFKDPSGKKIKVKSNSLTGDYQQLLDGGKTYLVTVFAGDVFRESFDVTTRTSDSAYVEQLQELRVKTLNTGRELTRFDGFAGSSLSANGTKQLKGLNKLMRFNRGLTLDIVVADADKKSQVEMAISKFKAIKKRVNVVIDTAAGNSIIYKVNKNEQLFD